MEFDQKDHHKLQWILSVAEGTSKVIVYVGDKNKNKVNDRYVNFKSSTHGITSFYRNSATVNTGKGIFISGGEVSTGVGSNLFFFYNPINNTLQRKEDMLEKKYSHSLLFNEDFVYCIGGYKSNTCERYDCKTSKWAKMSNLVVEERVKPILYCKNNFLYAFFGYSQGSYISTIERISVKTLKAKWELVVFNNPSNLSLGRIGSAIIPDSENAIFILGGKIHPGNTTSQILKFSFDNNTISLCDYSLEENAIFNESVFYKFEDGDHGLFNEEMSQLLKLSLD